MKPQISILMANYNKAEYLKDSIVSVRKQTNPNWELVIVDDSSSDESMEIIRNFVKKDSRIMCYRNKKNSGIAYTQNRLAKLATAPILGILDSDDTLAPEAIETVLKAYHNHPESGFIYSQFAYTDIFLHPYKRGECASIPTNQSNLTADCVSHFKTFRKSLYLKTEGYRSDLSPAEDMDMILKLEELTNFYFIDKILYYYRMLPNSFSHGSTKEDYGRLGYIIAVCEARKRRMGTNIPSLSFSLFVRRFIEGIYLSIKLHDITKIKLLSKLL